jgi:dolichyl-phosphate-mannose-protein mannosyltransferase
MVFCQEFDFVFNRFKSLGFTSKPIIGKAVMAAFLGLSVAVFTFYAPLVYGNPWTQSACESSKLLSGWDFNCNTFYTDVSVPEWQPPRRGY